MSTQQTKFTGIADEIRKLRGTTRKVVANNFKTELSNINTYKNNIKASIGLKGQTVGDDIATYAEAIKRIETGVSVPLNNCTGLSAVNIDGTRVALKYTDPNNSVYAQNGVNYTLNEWAKTTVRRSDSSYPTTEEQGTLVVDSTTKNQYSTKHLVVSGLVPNKTNYFSFFPTSKTGVITKDVANRVQCNTSLVALGNCSNIACENPKTGNTLTLQWTDPNNITKVIDGITYTTSTWQKTVVRMSTSDYPKNINEGQLVCESLIHNQFASSPYEVTGLTSGVKYYFTLFPVATNGLATVSDTNHATQTPNKISFAGGTHFTSSSPKGTKIGQNAGLTSPIATSLSQTTSNPYDNIPLFQWTEEVINGSTMIKIPKGYVKITDGGKDNYKVEVSDGEFDPGYHVHPCFLRPDGTEMDYIYVAKYTTGPSWKSVSGVNPKVSTTRPTFRQNAANLGKGWQQIDYFVLDYLRILWMVEFGTRQYEDVMKGNYSGSVKPSGGTNGKKSRNVQISNTYSNWGGIENFIGNVQFFVDGYNNGYGQGIWVTNDASKFNDSTFGAPYKRACVEYKDHSFYASRMVYDSNIGVSFPDEPKASSSTYFCDQVYMDSGTNYANYITGAYWRSGADYGLFHAYVYNGSSSYGSNWGSRLVYKPL